MWQPKENVQLIEIVQRYMARAHPTESMNNNHEFTGNLLDVITDWNLVSTRISKRSADECKQQWHHLVRQFLFITNHMNTENGEVGPAVFNIDWRSMEQMEFLLMYMNKYKRYEQSTMRHSNIEDTTDYETETEPALENDDVEDDHGPISSRELKRKVQKILSNKSQPGYAIQLKSNFESLYARESTGFCKVAYMIEIKAADWSKSKKISFLTWYYEYLIKTIKKYTTE